MALTLILLTGLLLVLALLLRPVWRSLRRAKQRKAPLPASWRRILRRRVPLVARLPADQQLRLKGLMQVFLAEKPILACAGLVVSDEMRVVIAAQACLPLLGHTRDYYPNLRQVLLYPGAFVVDRPVATGQVQMEQRRVLAGESWVQGQVLLAWDEVRVGAAVPDDGRNVVIHEFAHQLDQVKGHANGAPPLPGREVYAQWSQVLQAEFDALSARVARGEPSLLNAYGATDPAEFFAVASEVFFEQGAQMAAQHAALYQQLKGFYGVETAAWGR